MEPFTTHAGRAVPLRHSNVDTDQIIPAEYLKRVSRVGFADGLFAAWRADPEFVLNQPVADGATIVVAGPDFGIGSSREHAVGALSDYGFRAVVSACFGDIFRNNATKGGLLPARVTAEFAEELQDVIEKNPDAEVTVDLVGREVRVAHPETAEVVLAGVFEIDDYTRWRLMEGLDDISLTLRYADEITSFEQQRPSWLPTADPVR